MEAIKQWLISVLAAALLTGTAQALMPEGAVRKVGQLTSGLVLFLVMVSPVLSARYLELAQLMEDYRLELEAVEEETAAVSKNLNQTFIDQETEAYIQTRTQELDITCQVEVLWDWSGETPVPSGAVISGQLTEAEREQLTEALAADLGLSKETITHEKGAAP